MVEDLRDRLFPGGCTGFADAVERWAAEARERGAGWFVETLAREAANIDLSDLDRPWRVLLRLDRAPPREWGTRGFRPELVDDIRPARHYTGFVFVGYTFPWPLAVLALVGWESLGTLRYRSFSREALVLGWLGFRHGRRVRRDGPEALAPLIRAELCTRRGGRG